MPGVYLRKCGENNTVVGCGLRAELIENNQTDDNKIDHRERFVVSIMSAGHFRGVFVGSHPTVWVKQIVLDVESSIYHPKHDVENKFVRATRPTLLCASTTSDYTINVTITNQEFLT